MPVRHAPVVVRSWCAVVVSLAATATGWSQTAPANGPRQADLRVHAITDATVVIRPGQTIEHATIVIRDGVIEAVGADVTPPVDARVWSATGLTVYAGLIDAALLVSAGEITPGPAAHWNPLIHPELDAGVLNLPAAADAKALRDLGFGAAAVYPSNGIFRGSGVVKSLAADPNKPATYVERVAMAAGFDQTGGYPNSLMGSLALLRQTLLDAQWYREARGIWERNPQGVEQPARAEALEALDRVITGTQPVLFDAGNEHDVLRIASIVDEFNIRAMVLGSGLEFRRVSDVVGTRLPLIIPVRYPERPDVSTLDAAENVSLETLLNWEQAPTNARKLVDAGATVALTTNGLRNRADFYANVRRAITNGLTADEALAALTTTPATMLGVEHLLGTIEPGKVANLVVVEKTLFDKEMKVRDTWIDGRRYEINSPEPPSYIGAGTLRIARGEGEPIESRIVIDTKKRAVTVTLPDGKEAKAKTVAFDGDRLSFTIDGRLLGVDGYVQFSGTLTKGEFIGAGALPDLSRFTFTITPSDEPVAADEADEADDEAGADEGVAEGEGQEGRGERSARPDADPVSGEWTAELVADQMPGGTLPVTMSLALGDDGVSVTGRMETEFFQTDITGGRFDRAAGTLEFNVDAGGMSSTTKGAIGGGVFTGAVTGQGGFNAQINATRISGGQEERPARGGRGGGGGNRRAEDEDVAPDITLFPLGDYGRASIPARQSVLVHSATIWTCGPDGILTDGWMLVQDGKIAQVGTGGWPRIGVDLVIDAQGKHITPGLIDCHSHTGIAGGVNEGSQAVTAEVRIGDCVQPDDINWYRQLAGGLIGANQLHGSANPIGGQNSVVKAKWGGGVNEFRIADAIPGIKFALGENVKRSQGRYPNTRMGVEAVIRDGFSRAVDYRAEWERFNALTAEEKSRVIPPKRDLELDTLVEILEGRRLVHCHSYRQDEILMLLRVAEDFGFRVGTLQHILEGYKVAEAIAAHGAGASSFSDWWAYKVEVMDAIPYNGAIMHNLGIVVSFNSDSSELARRLNTEAAKAVRYGNVPPEEALKFVCLNPAKQLRIDHRTGSIEAGKDADFVIWSADPLSTYARCEQTWIEGACYFSLELDQEMRRQTTHERQRLIQKILAFQHGDAEGGDGESPKPETTETPTESSLH
jgi:imidazolonepropionase-like amidohydrolase